MRNTAVFTELLLLAFCCCGQSQAASFTLEEATVEGINKAFDAGLLTSEQLVHLYLDRIDAYDQLGPSLNSMLTLNPNALNTARELDIERQTNGPRSPLHGIPILLKDQLDTFDMPTTSGSLALRDSIPPDDAFIVSRLRNAGAIILGKTNLDEFGCCSRTLSSLGGQSKNPYNVTRVPGGSSGGTAAAIAANFAVVGTGSDSWGSIQEPASFQSLVGLMPTRSLISGDGTVPPPSIRRGVTGPIARTVADAVAMLDIIAGVDEADPITAASEGNIPDSYLEFLDKGRLNGARIGLVANFLGGARQDVRDLTLAATDRMQSLGATVVQVNLPSVIRLGGAHYSDFEFGMNRYLESLGPDARFTSLQEIIASGQYLSSLDDSAFKNLNGDIAPAQDSAYMRFVALRDAFEQQLVGVMEADNLDALVYPPLLSPPITIASLRGTNGVWETYDDYRNLLPSPFLGFPSITVPAGFDSAGMPVGIEFLGQPFSEPTLIGLAYAFEQGTAHRATPASTPPLPLFVPGRQSTVSRYASVINSAKDDDSDSDFDNTGDSAKSSRSATATAVGERDTPNANTIVRAIIKFRLPPVPEASRLLEGATLRLFLEDIAGTPAGPVSLLHSIDSNDRNAMPTDFEDSSYTDTELDIVQPTDMGQQYYELDVTELVLADYATDGADLVSAFRLQVNEAVFFEDDQSRRYRFTLPGAGTNPPELVLTFIPEPSTLVLAALGLLGLLTHARRRNSA